MKTGRNEPCPCGSNLKYKKCHGDILDNRQSFSPSYADITSIVLKKMQENADTKILREKQQGLGKPIISMELNGYRLVATGNKINYSQNWKTFPDFLLAYMKHIFGEGWGNNELTKPIEYRHPILLWYQLVCAHQRSVIKIPGQISGAVPTGAVEAYLQLSYNLYNIKHNVELQEKLIGRLKNKEQFPGALFETFVFGTLIKAGFKIEFEDEKDGRSKHCECSIISEKTQNKFSVEAKSIARLGILGIQKNATNKELGSSIRTQIKKALEKSAPYPRIIFISLNLPNFNDKILQNIRFTVQEFEKKLVIDGRNDHKAYIFFVNQSCYYHLEDPNFSRGILALGFRIPDFGYMAEFSSLIEMYKSTNKHIDMFDLAKSISEHHDIPNTFEPEIPEFLDEELAKYRMIIGKKYKIPDSTGKEVEGMLTTAIVLEGDKKIVGTFYVESLGQTFIIDMPMSEAELAIYKKYPDVFFGVYDPQHKRKISENNPYELFEFFIETYKKTPKDKLLEFVEDHYDFERLKSLSQEDLALIYCERLVLTHMQESPKDLSIS